jgi:hypothetical protein
MAKIQMCEACKYIGEFGIVTTVSHDGWGGFIAYSKHKHGSVDVFACPKCGTLRAPEMIVTESKTDESST